MDNKKIASNLLKLAGSLIASSQEEMERLKNLVRKEQPKATSILIYVIGRLNLVRCKGATDCFIIDNFTGENRHHPYPDKEIGALAILLRSVLIKQKEVLPTTLSDEDVGKLAKFKHGAENRKFLLYDLEKYWAVDFIEGNSIKLFSKDGMEYLGQIFTMTNELHIMGEKAEQIFGEMVEKYLKSLRPEAVFSQYDGTL